MSLLDDVSIVVTPNGVKASKLYAVVPSSGAADMDVTRATAATRVDENGLVNYAEIIGGEEVTNGDFATDTDWTKGAGWTISGGTASHTGGASYLSQAVLQVNTLYKVNISVTAVSGGGFVQIYMGNNPASVLISQIGDYTYYFTSQSSVTLGLALRSLGDVTIDNVSVKEAARDNVPRIDYTGGGCPHILAEPQRTNLVTYSEDFTQWGKSSASSINTITSTVISPQGVSYANKLYPIGSGSNAYIRQTIAGDCFSVFIKKGERRWVLIYGGFGNSNVWFDSENGVLGTVRSEATATVESFGNDWYRVKILWTQNTTQVRIYNVDDDNTLVSTGNGTDGLYIYGAQLEVGSYATSYIPTSGSTVTRNQDQFTRDGISSLINSTEGVLFVEMAALSNDGTNRAIGITDGSSSDRVIVRYRPTSGQIQALVVSGSTTQALITKSSLTVTDFTKIAVKYKVNDFALWIDGVEVGTDTSGIVPVGMNELSFHSGSDTNTLFAKVKQVQVYKTALTDAQLTSLTS